MSIFREPVRCAPSADSLSKIVDSRPGETASTSEKSASEIALAKHAHLITEVDQGSLPKKPEPLPDVRTLSREEERNVDQRLNTQLHMSRIYGDNSSSPNAFEKLVGKKSEQELVAEVCKAAGVPYDRIAAGNSLEAIIEKGINDAFARAGVAPDSRRESIPVRQPIEPTSGVFIKHQPRRAVTAKTVRETEAEAVAYVICQAIGLEMGTAAADYIQLHRGDAKLLLESLNYIRLAAGRILDGILENQSLPEVRAA